ncbi:hypothetical protein AWB68_07871 [Caballeronia choica]|uniref:IPT/TIG domain-containing protein n=1 Tax=Caballeronia choica TaxID=326476 RepID=A0A158KXX9_9BURK|nr:hypothetical protein [Caballeronia choica]SAL85992.1 hypothetical protein AWB68_07871 [Caballeronia choica]
MRQLLVAAVLIVAGIALLFVAPVAIVATSSGRETSLILPLFAVAGVVLLIATLALVSLAFGTFGLADKSQAMALPEGSIRAVIAVALVVLFAILCVFLFERLYAGGPLITTPELTESQVSDFKGQNPKVGVVVILPSNKDKANKLFVITYRDPEGTKEGTDFAKQLLVLIGTLVTAVSSFYFGAKTASAATTSTEKPKGAPTIRAMKPNVISLAGAPQTHDLEIVGDNLNAIKSVKVVRGKDQILGTNVVSNDMVVRCQIPVTADTALGQWDLMIIDGSSRQATLQNAITVDP